MIVSTTAATTPAAVSRCSDCYPAGTSYCALVDGKFTCNCKDGWSGATCNAFVSTAATTSTTTIATTKKDCTFCVNSGTQSCVMDGTHGIWCSCRIGYYGLRCEMSLATTTTSQPATTQPSTTGAAVNPTNCNQCSQAGTNSCSPSTNCIGTGCPVTCNCRTGWKGATCAEDVNECLEGSNRPCVTANTINCYNLYGDYSCICREGFNGKNCQNQVSGNLNSAAGWLLSFLK